MLFLPQAATARSFCRRCTKRLRWPTFDIPASVRIVSILSSLISQIAGRRAIHHGVELHQVKIVGCVFDVEDQSTFTKFEIEDSTGKVEVKLWKDQEDGGAFNERLNACR